MMIHFCAGKTLVQENIAPVDDYVHLVHNFKRRMTFAWHLKESFMSVKIEEYARNEVRLTFD